jgi:glycine/D-amino acid oxidase-like deaminating enzyme
MGKITRRTLLKTSAVLASSNFFSGVLPASVPSVSKKLRAIVIGAGAFGGWTALQLLRNQVKVTLVDSWGPGNSRASSGGETRVIRGVYGANRIYTQMAARAMQLWGENEKRWQRKLLMKTGALWMVVGSEQFELDALPILRELGLAYEKLGIPEASARFPQINFEGVQWVLIEKEAGYLTARQACQIVLEQFLKEGGEYKQLVATPGKMEQMLMNEIVLSDGTKLKGDLFVFACGPWLGKIFADLLGNLITPTRQEVFYFGTPAGDTQYNEGNFPVWINHGSSLFYGIPGNQWRGFKVADDTRGPVFDPTNGERIYSKEALKAARDLIEFRFPGMKGAPLLESRVCQYENSQDSNYIIDRHPAAENVWIVGGGSGHGFKMGPALGEYVAGVILGQKPQNSFFNLARFSK